jgi:hypothetical protein
LEYFTNTIDGKHRRIDVHSLKISGAFAHEMRVEDLYAKLKQMKCPRITAGMAKPDLLVRYGVWLQERAESKS